jgi:nicotinamide riboside kinase|tara:strand:+ start:1798 stop:2352 length:555 start_codon:yes stop_codon:yes gene_type:complete
MLVSFTGAQSSGKTTLLKKAMSDPDFRKWNFVPEVTRIVKRLGFNINELGDNSTQLFILSEHLRNHHLSGNTILDRCAVDGWVYTMHLEEIGKVDRWVSEYSRRLFLLLKDKLDIIFYTDHNIPLEDDGERSIDIDFRDSIVNKFQNAINSYTIKDKIIRLEGDVDTRYNIFKTAIRKHHDRIR